MSDLIKNLRDLAAFAHADLSVADEAAIRADERAKVDAEIGRLREAVIDYVNTVVEMEGVTFLEQMKNAELRLCIESILAEEPQG